jgi:alpha-mannosidase
MRPRQLTLVAHTHWDREWYEPFEIFRAQLVDVLDGALAALERDPRAHFTLDGQVVLIDDYLELRPEAEQRVRALVEAGRLHLGPFYTQADSLLVDGEGLIRNLAFGLHRAAVLGGATRIGYMADQFGHAAQVPQLLAMFGISDAVLWRGPGPDRPPHAFSWRAPDGTSVRTVWLQDGYGSGRRIPSDPPGFVAAIERQLERNDAWLGDAPLVVPIGDDHVAFSAWLPAARDALSLAHAELDVELGGYARHFGKLGPADTMVAGELRSPAFAPVLAGVASARVREKQAMQRVTQQLLRYAEPLSAWVTHTGGEAQNALLQRAWRYLLLNQAHDSAAGCGTDPTHEDVAARYRWAEQLAITARDRSLARLVGRGADEGVSVLAFVAAGDGDSFVVEGELPKSLEGSLVAVGADGVARPVQLLAGGDEQPIFEGEFSAADLGQHLGGLDPATPIFGRYLTGLSARAEGEGVVRLDVGLGDIPATAARLAGDQARLAELLTNTARFKVVLHNATPMRSALLQGGRAGEAELVRLAIRAGEAAPSLPTARALEGNVAGIAAGTLSVRANEDGSVQITDGDLTIRANDLVDEGDRGDLYHAEPVGQPLRARASKATVVEAGPLRARLRVEQTLEVPVALAADRTTRGPTAPLEITTEISVRAGERRVDFVTTLHNAHRDHRLRALVHAPFSAARFDVEHGLAVVGRPFDPAAALGSGAERAATTGQHHLFVDVGAGDRGVALMSRGLLEHEVLRDTASGSTQLALTLLRSVGWLARGDLQTIDHAAGPIIATPDAQELGAHRFEYALLLHRGDWREGGALPEARRYAAPPISAHGKSASAVASDRTIELGAGTLVKVSPASVIITALHPDSTGRGLIVRVLNTAAASVHVRIQPQGGCAQAIAVDPLERSVDATVVVRDGGAELELASWRLATVRLT